MNQRNRFISSAAPVVAVGFVYAAVAKASFSFTIPPGNISPVFPAAGLALAAVMVLGRKALLGVWLGSFAANTISFIDGSVSSGLARPLDMLVGAVIGLGAMAGAAAGSFLVRRFCRGEEPLYSGKNVLVLVLFGALGCCLISPTVGVMSLAMNGKVPWSQFGDCWVTWWVGDASGALVAAPLLLAWWQPRSGRQNAGSKLEAVALVAATIGVCLFVFFRRTPFQYVLLPLVLWSAFRFGMRGATTSAAVITFFAVVGASLGTSPFVSTTVNESLLLLNSFLAVTITCALFLAGLLEERQQAGDALRESEARVRLLGDNLPDSYVYQYTIKPDGTPRFLHVSAGVERLHGVKAEESLRDASLIFRQIAPEMVPAYQAAEAASLAKLTDFAMELPMRRADGQWRWMQICSRPRRTDDGAVLWDGVVTDITQRKQAEETIRQNEERFRAITENLTDLVAVLDVEGRRLYNSPSYRTLLGDPEQLCGTISFEQIHPEDRERVRNSFQKTVQTGVGERLEYRLVDLSGQMRHIESQGSVIHDEQGRVAKVLVVSRDVTERHRTEAALRQSEAALRSVFKAAPVGICILEDRLFRHANTRWFEITAYPKAEFLGKSLRQLYETDQEFERVGRELYSDLGKRGMNLVETRFVCGDGGRRDVIMTAAPLNPDDPSNREVVVVVQDVTARRQAEAARRESERNYRELVELANSIILRWNAEGHITFLNDFGLRFFGYAAEEIFGRHVMGTIVPQTENGGRDLQRLMEEICANPAAFEQNTNENMRRNGERVWIAWTNRVVRDPSGQVVEILSVGTDVSAQRRADEQIRRLNDELQRYAAELEQRVAERTQELRALSLRQQALAEIELAINQPHELRAVLDQIVQHVTRLLPASGGASVILWDAGQQQFDLCATTVPHQSAQEAARRIRRRGGATRWIIDHREALVVPDVHDDPRGANPMLAQFGLRAYAGFPLLNDGQVLGVLYVQSKETHPFAMEDRGFLEAMGSRAAAAISKVRMYEELDRAKTQAEAADRLKSTFLATMSHELRTPLNSIIGFTGILLQGLAGPLNPEQSKQLDMVRSSARHLLALINDVLDISKIEAGQLQVVREPFDVRASITKVVGLVTPLAEKKGLPLSAQLAPNIVSIVSDARRVEQILLNLLNNAVKFTEQGQVTLEATVTDSTCRIAISDTGIGIKPEDLANLFQPFRQVDTGLTRNHEGTGLGLAICRRLAELLGGEILAESEWGKGSVFTVILPLHPAAEDKQVQGIRSV